MASPTTAGTQTLNAITPFFSEGSDPGRDDRTERHLRQCRELAELGMALARAAADRALHDLAVEAPPNPAEPATRKPDAALAFIRISRAVRLAITLEAHIAAGPEPEALPSRPMLADPRRAPLRRALRIVTETSPDRAALRRDSEERLESELAGDPLGTASIPDLLFAICEDLDIDIDLARIPSEFLPTFDEAAFEHEEEDEGEDGNEDGDDLDEGIDPGEIRTPPLRI